jgi:hypothetical protein
LGKHDPQSSGWYIENQKIYLTDAKKIVR